MADRDEARRALVASSLETAASLHQASIGACTRAVMAAADLVTRALAAGGQVLVFGNGGSAADAQHFAAELIGRFEKGRERRAWPALALASDASVVTALANDLGYEQVFARQVEAFGRPGDVALGLTTSGTSPNVRLALDRARAAGLATIAFTGRCAGLVVPVDVHVAVPDDRTPRVQEVHGTLLHVLCELVEGERV
ncbi:MAG: SIS domain-containing protein [Acidobacteria bacterium]|nr:SIS domain-containing protein [Acidobacteriota bacterium]